MNERLRYLIWNKYNQDLAKFGKLNKINKVTRSPNLEESSKFHTTSKERYTNKRECTQEQFLSIKNSEFASESSKLIYDIINETPEGKPKENTITSKRHLYQNGYKNGKGKKI